MSAIIVPFTPTSLGRIEFDAEVMTGDNLSFDTVTFKLDTGSDFTTLSCADLALLGYSNRFLESRERHDIVVAPAASKGIMLQYIEDVSIKFGDRELQGCRVFFKLNSNLHSFFGSDLLKYFNYEVNQDEGELRLSKSAKAPVLSKGEKRIYIYALSASE